MTKEIREIDVDLLEIKDQIHRTKMDISSLMASIETTGQINPIVVKPLANGKYRVVAGRRRCAALKLLQSSSGKKIKALVVIKDLDKLHEELITIDENIMREQLKDAELDEALFRRKQIYERLHPETKQHVAGGKSKAGKSSAPSFTKETSQKLGITTRTVERSIARASKASESVKQARAKGLSQSKVDLLVALRPQEQDLLLPVIMDRDLEKTRQLVERAKTRGVDNAIGYVKEIEAPGKDSRELLAVIKSAARMIEQIEERMIAKDGLKSAERYNHLRVLEQLQLKLEKFITLQRAAAGEVVAIRRSADHEKIIRARVRG